MDPIVRITKQIYKNEKVGNKIRKGTIIIGFFLIIWTMGMLPLPSSRLPNHIHRPGISIDYWYISFILLIVFVLLIIINKGNKISIQGALSYDQIKLTISFEDNVTVSFSEIQFIEIIEERELYIKAKDFSQSIIIDNSENSRNLKLFIDGLNDKKIRIDIKKKNY